MYLVVSMTAATGLLLWMEHLVAPPDAAELSPPAAGPAAEAVQIVQDIQPGTWDEVVISYRERVTSIAALSLAATGQRSPYHFVVDREGRVKGMSAWQDQERDEARTGVGARAIRVCLTGGDEGQGVSAEQWDALMSLLRQLRVRCYLPTKAVRLDPQLDPQFRPDASNPASRLRQMLLAADIID